MSLKYFFKKKKEEKMPASLVLNGNYVEINVL